jgi:hypothetical protein
VFCARRGCTAIASVSEMTPNRLPNKCAILIASDISPKFLISLKRDDLSGSSSVAGPPDGPQDQNALRLRNQRESPVRAEVRAEPIPALFFRES